MIISFLSYLIGGSERFDILIVGSYIEIDVLFLLQIPVDRGSGRPRIKTHKICGFYFFTEESKADGIVL